MVNEWKISGFNDVPFIECYLEPTRWEDFEADGRSRDDFEKTISDYAIFVAHPDLYIDLTEESQYHSTEVDWNGFTNDVITEIKRRVGEDVSVKHYSGCHEYEVQRES